MNLGKQVSTECERQHLAFYGTQYRRREAASAVGGSHDDCDSPCLALSVDPGVCHGPIVLLTDP